MQRVYALIDKELLQKSDITLEKISRWIEESGIKIAQYRNKNPKSKAEIEKDLKLIRSIFSGDLIINDYLEFIDLADGIHLGQEDLEKVAPTKEEAVKRVREKVGKKIFGISTHNKDEVLEANRFGVDYIGLGAYRDTQTKRDAKVSGKRLLEVAKLSIHPVAIIGGVKLDDEFDESIWKMVVGSDIIKKIKEIDG